MNRANGHHVHGQRVKRPSQLTVQADPASGVVHVETPPAAWMKFDPLTAMAIGKGFIDSAIACGAAKPDWYTPT